MVTFFFYGRREFHELRIMSVVHGDTAQNSSLRILRVLFPVTKCFSDLCNISLSEVVTWNVQNITCFVRSGFGMLEEYVGLP